MSRFLCWIALGLTGVLGLSAGGRRAESEEPIRPLLAPPLRFERNVGQRPTHGQFLAQGRGFTVGIEPTVTEFVLPARAAGGSGGTAAGGPGGHRQGLGGVGRHPGRRAPAGLSVRMALRGADRSAMISPGPRRRERIHYYRGTAAKQWRRNVETFSSLLVRSVYPGIDLVYHCRDSRVEYDFVVGPHADPDRIVLAFQGQDAARLSAAGDLVLSTPVGEVRHHRPVAFQEIDGSRRVVTAAYVIDEARETREGPGAGGSEATAGVGEDGAGAARVRFRLGAFDSSLPLVIDPVLAFSDYYNTAATGDDEVTPGGIALSQDGSVFVSGSFRPPGGADTDLFVHKRAPDGEVIYTTMVGGSSYEGFANVAVDRSGSAFLAAVTVSRDFPIRAEGGEPFQKTSVSEDVVVAKLSPAGELVYSTYLGGDASESAGAPTVGLALCEREGASCAVVCGATQSLNFPAARAETVGYSAVLRGRTDVFVAIVNQGGTGLHYATLLGGGPRDEAYQWGTAVAVAESGSVYVTGGFQGEAFPVTHRVDPRERSKYWASPFLVVLDPAVSGVESLRYSTWFGYGQVLGLALGKAPTDERVCAFVAGSVHPEAPRFPATEAAFSTFPAGGGDLFLAKLAPGDDHLAYGTLLGGSDTDPSGGGASVAVDASGCAYLAASTRSFDFPVVSAFQSGNHDGPNRTDLVVTKLNAAGSALRYSSYFGGTGDEVASAVALSSTGELWIMGWTGSRDLPRAGPDDGTPGDVFLARITGGATPPQSPLLEASRGDSEQVDLTVTDQSGDETGFRIERRSLSEEKPFRVIARPTAQAGTGGRFTFRDEHTAPFSRYLYRVQAVNADSGSDYSTTVTGDTIAPPAPSESVQVTNLPDGTVKVIWRTVTGATGYYVERAVESGPFDRVSDLVAEWPYLDQAVEPNTRYAYRVVSSNEAGTSAPSAPAEVLSPPAAATNLAVTRVTSTSVAVEWRAPGARPAAHRVERATNGAEFAALSEVPAGSTAFTDRGVAPRRRYQYRVIAFNATGESEPSAVVEAWTPRAVRGELDAPTILQFGRVRVGRSRTLTLRLRNANKNEDLRLKIGEADPPFAVITAQTERLLGPGGSFELRVKFRASRRGAVKPPGELVLKSSDPRHRRLKISLKGKGI
jgi:hypothetical protein